MTASAAAILAWNAIPVFADISPKTYNLCPESVLKSITPRTKAIMMPLIFGSAGGLIEVKRIAEENGLVLIEDAAQAPYVRTEVGWAGTMATLVDSALIITSIFTPGGRDGRYRQPRICREDAADKKSW